MDKCEEFLKDVCSYIKNKDVHEEVKEELRGHIIEMADEFIQGGMNEDEAIGKAVDRMGDSFEIGEELNKVHKSGPDKISIFITSVLLSIGIITMYSLKSKNMLPDSLVINNIVGGVIGLAFGFSIYFFDYRKIKKYSYAIYITGIIVGIIVSLTHRPINGQFGSISVFGVTISMVIILPIILLIGICGIFERIEAWNAKNYLKILGIMVLPCIFLISLGFSSLVLYGVVLAIMFLFSSIKRSVKIGTIILGFCMAFTLFYSIIASAPYRIERFYIFFNPYRDSEGLGWLFIKIRESLSSLKLIGSSVKNYEIPSLDTDLVFVYILQTFGIVVGVVCLVAIILLIIRCYKNALRIKNSYGKKLIITITSIITVQFTISILFNLSFSMITYSIPFLSSGGSSLMINTFLIGMMCCIYKRKDLSFDYKIN